MAGWNSFLLGQNDSKLTGEGLALKRRLQRAMAKKEAKAAA